MNNNVSLFKNMPAAAQELIDQIDPIDNLAGNSFGTNRRISIRGGVFREVVNGKEQDTWEGRALNVVILNAAPLSRSFYAGKYKEGEASAPTCWSADCKTPDARVAPENKQALRCADCPQNIRGSSDNGESRACRYQQRVAIMLADEIESRTVYQLALPSTSIFGDGTKDKMPMQAYARFLRDRRTPAVAIATEMRLDTDASTPKLTFKAVRALTEKELPIAVDMQKHEDTIRAITFTVSQMDGVKTTATAAHVKDDVDGDMTGDETTAEVVTETKPAARRQKKEAPPETPAPITEPTKRASKSAAPERVQNEALADIIKDWGTDDD